MLLLAAWYVDLFQGINGQHRFVLMCVAMLCATGAAIAIGAIAANAYGTAKKREFETELKRDLIAQGMSAEEIERIINPSDGFSRAVESWSGRNKKS